MANAVLVDAAEAVKTAIEGHDFGLPFVIERNYADYDLELEDLTELRMDIVPVRHVTAELETREHLGYETDVDICIRRKFGETDAEPDLRLSKDAIDALCKLTEDVHELLTAEALNENRWTAAKILLCPNKKHLRVNRQFTSLIRVTYQTSKAIP